MGTAKQDVTNEVINLRKGVENVEQLTTKLQARHEQLKGFQCYGSILCRGEVLSKDRYHRNSINVQRRGNEVFSRVNMLHW